MVIAKKIEFYIKLIMFVILIIYITVFNSNFAWFLPINNTFINNTMDMKKLGNNRYCFLLLGGSNIELGVAAKILSNSGCFGVNLGISTEGGGFNKYSKWIDNLNVETEVVFYSSALMWSASEIEIDAEQPILCKLIPSVAIVSQIKAQIKKYLNIDNAPLNSLAYDNFGDLLNFSCQKGFAPFVINIDQFQKSNRYVVNKIIDRILAIKKIVKSQNIFIRVPPIYTAKQTMSAYQKLINDRVSLLKDNGVIFINQSQIVFDDNKLFCDAFHPNSLGREYFSEELIDFIKKYSLRKISHD